MLNFLKNVYAWGYFVATGNTEKIFNDKGYEDMAFIKPMNGKFALLDRDGNTVQTYARERDARRGANRRGLTLA